MSNYPNRTWNVVIVGTALLTYLATGVLMLQSTNRYSWMLALGARQLPLDEDSRSRVIMFASAVALSAAVSIGLALGRYGLQRDARGLRIIAWLLIPLAYAGYRAAGAL